MFSWQGPPIGRQLHEGEPSRLLRYSLLIVVALAGALIPGTAAGASNGATEARDAARAPAGLASQTALASRRCARLKGAKLRRCKALARCRKLKSKKRKRCLARARKIGAKKAPPTAQRPPSVQPPPPTTQPPPGQPPPGQPPLNQPPRWPSPFSHQTSTSFDYDPTTGLLRGATTTINVLTPALDPDGDPVSYSWSASNGSITGSGLSATWTRVISAGRPMAGTVTITASDGPHAVPLTIRFL